MTRYQWRPDLEEHEVIPGTENEPMRIGEKLLLTPELNLGTSRVVGNPEVKPKEDTTTGAHYIPWYDRNPEVSPKALPKVKAPYTNLQNSEVERLKKENTVLRKYGKPDKKFLEDLEEVKWEEGIGLVGQTSGKQYEKMAEAVKMNDHYDLATPIGKAELKHVQKTAYQYGNAPKPHWLDREEKQKEIKPSGLGNKNLTSHDPRTPVQKKRDDWEQKKTITQLKQLKKWAQGDTEQNISPRNMPQNPKAYNKGGVAEKRFDLWRDGIKTDKSPENVASVRKIIQQDYKRHGLEYIDPEDRKYLMVNGKLPGEAPKAQPEVSHNTQMLNDMEDLAKHRLDSQILENKFHEIMKPQRDPDVDKGIASVDGVENFKQVVDLADQKFPKRPTGYEGIGPNLTGQPDKVI